MARLRFIGSDRSTGRQIDGVTYFPGDVAELSEYWAVVLVRGGFAEVVDDTTPARHVPPPEQEPVSHRDPPVRRRRK